MPLRIVRNDITKMNTEAIVNTAGSKPIVGTGCDTAIYNAAGYEKLLKAREEIGTVAEGEAFITPGFELQARYIIHAVSPLYIDGDHGEEDKLRNCYKNSLALALKNNIASISFPLIATGGFGYPRAYGLRVALDEINAFLIDHEMDINLVVFDEQSTELATKLHPQIEALIEDNEVRASQKKEYGFAVTFPSLPFMERRRRSKSCELDAMVCFSAAAPAVQEADYDEGIDEDELHNRIKHVADPFGVYLLYLAERQGKTLTELENTAWVSKHVVHNVKKKTDTYKPDKRTAFQFALGLELTLDDTRDLLSRAGYAISPSALEDKIWEFYIENEHYDIIDVSDSLEKYGLKPIIDF